MSKKLVFKLKPVVSAMGSALEVHMHRGGSMHVEPFRDTIYAIPADETMSDAELLQWYGRYSPLGLETSIADLVTEEPEQTKDAMPEVLVNPIPPSVQTNVTSSATPDVRDAAQAQSIVEETPKPAHDMFMESDAEEMLTSVDADIISEVAYDVEEKEEQKNETPNFDSMSTSQLRDYCKEHNIQVNDMRSRNQLLTAIKNAQS